MNNKKMFRNLFVLFFMVAGFTGGLLFTDKSAEGKCVSLCNQHFLGGCNGSQPSYAAAAASTRGTCLVRLNNIPETDFNTIIANMSCDSSNNNQTCLPEFCPTSGFGLSNGNSQCQVYYNLVGTDNASCKAVGTTVVKGGVWDNARNQCIECSGNQGYIWGTSTGIAYSTPPLVFKEACGADAVCDGKTVGNACGTGVCDKDGGCCFSPNILDVGNNCVAAAVCNNDGTCNGVETTANCPNDCCTRIACGAGCTNATDCMTIEPDCAGACILPACASDTDCGAWVCDSGAGYIAENCATLAFLVCGGLDGTNCGGGNVWNCTGSCNPGCDPNWFPGGCGVTPSCVDEYDACDCACVAVACNNDGAQNNGETGIDCGGGGCPACAACTPNGCGGGCPAGCTGADDPDCAGACLISLFPGCPSDLDCCTNTPCVAPQVCNAATGVCVSCLTSADCAADEVCELGVCIPCSGEGVAETDPLLCCSGLNIIDGVCTSACDPSASFFCNPLRESVETLVQGGEKMIGYILGIIGSVALLLMIISGTMYMTSAGNEERIASSKKILTGAIIGLAISLLSFSLLQLLISIL